MSKQILLIVGVLVATIVLSGCITGDTVKTGDSIICNEPYIRVGADCCLDQDDNSICDSDDTGGNESKDFEVAIEYNGDPSTLKTNPKTLEFAQFDFVVYRGVRDYLASLPDTISYTPGVDPEPTMTDFIMRHLDNEVQKEFLVPLADKIRAKSSFKRDQANMAVDLVQNLYFDSAGVATDNFPFRYPYEVLYDGVGTSDSKSELLAFLLRNLGFGVAIFDYETEGFQAVGIKCSKGDYDTDYCFIEPTGLYPVGEIPVHYIGGADIEHADPEVIIISEGSSYD